LHTVEQETPLQVNLGQVGTWPGTVVNLILDGDTKMLYAVL
jgi:hypothetical protein